MTKTELACEICHERPSVKDSLCVECAEIEDATIRAEYNHLRAEIERLTKAEGAFLSEVKRLRAVLFQIADDSAHADQYVRWAQDALERPK